MAPSLDTLIELLQACGFDLSLDLVPHQPVDASAVDETAKLTPQERVARMLSRLESERAR